MPHKTCELCNSDQAVTSYEIPESPEGNFQTTATLCSTCRAQIETPESLQPTHWHCLNESIWSENPAVKVLAWRVLQQLSSESWAQDLLDQLYLEEDLLEWAKAGATNESDSETTSAATKDSNGAVLNDGDSVTLIKDLDVKGAGFTAKRGTLVKKITLTDDPALVEGKVNGTQIVLKTCFLKKSI